jgi:hypothetical protein
MKPKKIFEFAINASLDDARREAVELAIEQAAETYATDLEYGWQEDDSTRLHVFIKQVEIEIHFNEGVVEILAAAPIWAKAAFNDRRKNMVGAMVEEALREARLITTPETA